MLMRAHYFSVLAILYVTNAFCAGPIILSSHLTVDESGTIVVKPEMVNHFNLNNQTGIAEGRRNSFMSSGYHLEIKKNNGKIEKIFEMFPKATFIQPAMGKGIVVKDVKVINQKFKDGQLSDILMCNRAEERSTFLFGSIESPVKKNSYDCFMANRSMCEEMRDTIRRLGNGNGAKNFKELASKINECRENFLANAVIALGDIDEAISVSTQFPKMLEESQKELIKKFGDKGVSLGKPEVNFNQGKQAFENLLGSASQVFYSVTNYAEICDKFLPGEEGTLEKKVQEKPGVVSK